MSRVINQNPKVDTQEFHNVNSPDGKLLFTKCTLPRGKATIQADMAVLYQNNRVIAAQVLPEDFLTGGSQVGSIYIGKIQNISPQLNACFVEIGKNASGSKNSQVCFLPLKEAEQPFLINRPWDGKLKAGDELLVQITRDAQKTKGCSCSTRISLSNDYLAISAGEPKLLFSLKLREEQKQEIKNGLEKLGQLQELQTMSAAETMEETGFSATIPYQVMIRTKAGGLELSQLAEQYQQLRDDFQQLYQTARSRVCFTCLKKSEATYEPFLEHMVHPWEYNEIVTDNPKLYELFRKKQSLSEAMDSSQGIPSVRLYQDSLLSLNRLYGLDSKIEEALKSRIWLKSGANLIIEPTEALTVIDVNSAKKEASKGTSDSALKINLEAAEEIALQLRLRNLSGIIVVDFINMKDKEQESTLLKALRAAVALDTAKTRVIDMTPLGLVEITRKKMHKPLAEQVKEL